MASKVLIIFTKLLKKINVNNIKSKVSAFVDNLKTAFVSPSYNLNLA